MMRKSRSYIENVPYRFLAATKLRMVFSVFLSVCPSVTPFSVCSHCRIIMKFSGVIIQPSCWGGILVSLRPSVRPSVRPSRMPCPLCIIYSYGWILFILGTNDHYHERVCRAPWPLTLTYIFKVIWPWLRKLCPLCSVYSSGWILSIFGTNDHYH